MSKRWGCFFVLVGAILGVLATRDPRNKKKMFVLGPYWASVRIAVPVFRYEPWFQIDKDTVRGGSLFATELSVYLAQRVLINLNWGKRSGRFHKPPGVVFIGNDYYDWERLERLRKDIPR